jgi:ArsR family transcriptional regulator
MNVDLKLAPKRKRPAGETCCQPVAYPRVSAAGAERIALVAKALSDPIRVQIVDVLAAHGGEVCVCELLPLFHVSQPTLSHHLKSLREAGVIGVERRGLWSYPYLKPESLEVLKSWLP